MERKKYFFDIRSWLCLLMAVVCIVILWKYSWQKLEIAFALGQTKVFNDMMTDAEKITDPYKLSGYLEYVILYYPSGTRIRKDSPLDKMVEIERSYAVKTIIERFHVTTGKDLGDTPEKWFIEYPPPR